MNMETQDSIQAAAFSDEFPQIHQLSLLMFSLFRSVPSEYSEFPGARSSACRARIIHPESGEELARLIKIHGVETTFYVVYPFVNFERLANGVPIVFTPGYLHFIVEGKRMVQEAWHGSVEIASIPEFYSLQMKNFRERIAEYNAEALATKTAQMQQSGQSVDGEIQIYGINLPYYYSTGQVSSGLILQELGLISSKGIIHLLSFFLHRLSRLFN